ncbi:type II toxin-antitoxin system PemK/MazF family toxin [Nocardia yunnanensis]|uniref:Type II toxin-antitoxin system PemK/MazF family toxin n=1 Tax=Nocardia yunnanensis TaxID=2382165 RepID=A0A386ZI99_9NOCA|nr:type II toxin-antitoxin system PemK/MazF family toxin [Nocardia yunnanensis]AYF77278.1 type II toxin-antitoxin system PemK/MazF family toxin [Nocardia yunnanensis]
MIRGSIFPIDLGKPRGHEQGGRRFGVIMSQANSSTVVVVPTSTSAQPSRFRPVIDLGDGRETRLLADQIRAIDVAYLTSDMLGYLDRDEMDALETAVRDYLDL